MVKHQRSHHQQNHNFSKTMRRSRLIVFCVISNTDCYIEMTEYEEKGLNYRKYVNGVLFVLSKAGE